MEEKCIQDFCWTTSREYANWHIRHTCDGNIKINTARNGSEDLK